MSKLRDNKRRNKRGSYAAPLPEIRADGLPHHATYDPRSGTHRCLPDCPSCTAAASA